MSTMEFTQLSWEHPNRTDLAVEFKDRPGVFVTDGCCHPRDWVHAFASMVLTYNFETEYARSQTLSERGPRYDDLDPPLGFSRSLPPTLSLLCPQRVIYGPKPPQKIHGRLDVSC